MKLRNTYQVPSGQQVSVDTPQGQKTYRGGQFVPPQELGHAHVASSSGSQKEQSKGGNNEDQGPGWEEIVQHFKGVDISNPSALNKASYNIQQFLPFPITTSSNKVSPIVKFAAELALANFTNSIPGSVPYFLDGKTSISIHSPQDTPPTRDLAAGGEYSKIGHLDLTNNNISLWQNSVKVPETFYQVSSFISHKLSLLLFHLITDTLSSSQETIKKLTSSLKQNQNILSTLIKKYEKAPNKAESDPNIIEIKKNIKESNIEIDNLTQLSAIMEGLNNSIKKEGSDDEHIDSMIPLNLIQATVFQASNILKKANTFSLGINKTFENSLELLATASPETLTNIKNIITHINTVAQDKQQLESPE